MAGFAVMEEREARGFIMKNLGLITKNKVLAQSLASLIKNNPDLEFNPFTLLNFRQAALDAEVLKIDVAVIEMLEGTSRETGITLSLCEELRQVAPDCMILLLIPQDNKEGRDMAMTATKRKAADDYVFLDSSLDYLLAKLLAF